METLPHLRKTPAKHSRELKYVILAFRRFPRYSILGKLATEDPSRRETQAKMRRRRREERKEGRKEDNETRRKRDKKKRSQEEKTKKRKERGDEEKGEAEER